MIRFIVGS